MKHGSGVGGSTWMFVGRFCRCRSSFLRIRGFFSVLFFSVVKKGE